MLGEENMEKIIIPKEESPNLQKIMRDFCLAKQAVYNYDSKTFARKVGNFERNIKYLVIADIPSRPSGGKGRGKFMPKTKEIYIFVDDPATKFSSRELQTLIHELNHAWNYEEGKQLNIFSLPINDDDYKKYLCLMETLNEAETQLLCSDKLKEEDIRSSRRGEFSGAYRMFEESIFKTLCIICNQNGTQFLRSIDGMNVIEIISYISKKTGCSIEETKSYIDTLGLLHYSIEDSFSAFDKEHIIPILKKSIQIFDEQQSESDRDSAIQNLLNDWLDKSIQIKEYIPEYQKIYQLSRKFIDNISIYSKDEKQMALLKFEAIQDILNKNIVSALYLVASAIDSDRSQDIIESHPNLKVVEHEEYDKTNANVEFGKIDSHDLITNTEFQFSWDYRQENEVQKSLKGKNLFSRVTTSALNKVKNFIHQHITINEEKGDETRVK